MGGGGRTGEGNKKEGAVEVVYVVHACSSGSIRRGNGGMTRDGKVVGGGGEEETKIMKTVDEGHVRFTTEKCTKLLTNNIRSSNHS